MRGDSPPVTSASARASTSAEAAAAYRGEAMTFGPDYLIPKPFDPRLSGIVSSSVARAAMETGVATRPATIRAGIGARAGVTWFTREFPDWEVARQVEASLTAGPGTFLGVYRGRFSAELQLHFSLLFTSWDGANLPVTQDLLLGLGYRF